MNQVLRIILIIFLLFCWGSYTHLILVQWHRWSPHIPHQSSLTSAGANCHTVLKLDSPSPAAKKDWISICRCQANNFKTSFSYKYNQSMCFIEREGVFSQDHFVVALFCFLSQFCWQLFPCDTAQGCLSELRVHLCRKIHFKASKNTKHLILM